MKERVNQLFKDKLVLVMLVLGLLTIVAAAGAVRIRKGAQNMEESPYLEIKEPEGMIAGETEPPRTVAGSSNAQEAEPAGAGAGSHVTENTLGAAETEAAALEDPPADEAGAAAGDSLVLDFTESDRLLWPVQGNVILGYSMDTTTWFPTLEQYKCNPANVIQSEVSTPVSAPADARILEVGVNEEIGNYVRLDLGNGYQAVCGQLKEIPVVENEYVSRGDVLGYVAEPTKYYSLEGASLTLSCFPGTSLWMLWIIWSRGQGRSYKDLEKWTVWKISDGLFFDVNMNLIKSSQSFRENMREIW